jgi:two-component system, LytTR family, response regulator
MLRVLIVDDEPVARRRIRRFLRAEGDIEVVGEAGDGRAALRALEADVPDLMFLDVQMPELDGFEVVKRAPRLPAIVFVTAYDQYALRAFEVHALDYLLKPFTRDRLHDAILRVRAARIARSEAPDSRLAALIEEVSSRPRYLRRLPGRAGPRIVLLEAAQIDWIQAADNYVVLHAGGREYLMRETMARLEQELDPEEFARIHRSALVRIDRVAELLPSPHGDFRVTLKSGAQLTLSRFYRERLERVLRRAL